MSQPATKSVHINAPVTKVFSFLANLANWPKWAVNNVIAVKPGSTEWWAMETRTGLGRIRIKTDEAAGTIDYDLISAGVQWPVSARLVANAQGCDLTLTFTRPSAASDESFAKQVQLADKELAALKNLME